MVKNKNVALAFRLFCFVFTLTGLLSQMHFVDGKLATQVFMYYTTQSNILALFLFGLLSVKTFLDIRKNGKTGDAGYYTRFEMVCVIDLLLTLIVFWVLLAPSSVVMDIDMKLWSFSNLSVHLIVPIMCIVDFYLFNKPGRVKYSDVYYVTIFPLAYVIYSSAAGFLGYVFRIGANGVPVRFPYFFIDWDMQGGKVFVYIFALLIVFLFIGHIVYWIDKKRAKKLIIE